MESDPVLEAQKRFAPYFEFYLNHWFKNIETTGLENLRDLPSDTSTVYVSSHKSHVDWISLGFTLHKENIKVPRFVATQRLEKTWVVGSVLKKLGAKFIDPENRDIGYLTKLRRNLEADLLSGQDLLFFPESGRSYSGELKEMTPYFLLLPIQLRRTKENVRVVPLAISYDSVIEDASLVRLAQENKKESRFDRLKSTLFSRILGNKGKNIYIDIGRPISVKKDDTATILADQAYPQIERLYRITPTSLAAHALNSNLPRLDDIKETIHSLQSVEANLSTVRTMSTEEIYDAGINVLESRRAVKRINKVPDILNYALISYYANMLPI